MTFLRTLWSRYKAHREAEARRKEDAVAYFIDLCLTTIARLQPEDVYTIKRFLVALDNVLKK